MRIRQSIEAGLSAFNLSFSEKQRDMDFFAGCVRSKIESKQSPNPGLFTNIAIGVETIA